MREIALTDDEKDALKSPLLKRVTSGTPPFDVKVYHATWTRYDKMKEQAQDAYPDLVARARIKAAARLLIWRADEVVLRKMLTVSKLLLEAAVADANRDDAAEYWFGDTVDVGVVSDKLTKYSDFMSNIQKMFFECASEPLYANSFAAVNQSKHDATSKKIRVTLGGGFRNGSYELGAIINTCLHEFSHVCLRTNDEPLGSDVNYYTAAKARGLAQTNPTMALRNAENWGYYLCDFQTETDRTVSVAWGEPRRPSP